MWKNFSVGFEPSKVSETFTTVQFPNKQRTNHVSTERFKPHYEIITNQARKVSQKSGAVKRVKAPMKCSFCQSTDHKNTINGCPKKSSYGIIVPPHDINTFSTYLCSKAPRGPMVSSADLNRVEVDAHSGKKRHMQIRTVHPIRQLQPGSAVRIEELAFHVQLIGGLANDVAFNGKISGADLSKFLTNARDNRHIFQDIDSLSTGPGFVSPPDPRSAFENNEMYPNINGVPFGRYPLNQPLHGQTQLIYPMNNSNGNNAMTVGGTSINQTVQGFHPGYFIGNRSHSQFTRGMDATMLGGTGINQSIPGTMLGGTSINQSIQGIQTSHSRMCASQYAQGNEASVENDDFFKGSTSL